MEDRRIFLIKVENRWKLWILPVIGLLYFGWVLFLSLGGFVTPGIPTESWVVAGAGLFGLVILLQLPFFIKRNPPKPKRRRGRDRDGRRARNPYEAAPPVVHDLAEEEAPVPETAEPPSPPTGRMPEHEHEIRATKETHKGLQVLEVSHPPKSLHRGAVYSKAMVRVDDQYALRVEELVADSTGQ